MCSTYSNIKYSNYDEIEVLVMLMEEISKAISKSERKKRVHKEEKQTVINQEGEILTKQINESFLTEAEPDFVKLYVEHVIHINGLPDGVKRTLNALLKLMTYENMIILNPFVKNQIKEELGYKNMQSLNNNLNKLVKSEILFRKGTGTYQMNPFLFAKGKWEDIKKIRYEVVYEEGHIKQKAHFEYEDDEKE